MKRGLLLFILVLVSMPVMAQDRFELFFMVRPKRERIPQKTISIKEARSPIEIDGSLDEPAWEEAEMAREFHQYFPTDTLPALSNTEVRLTYDQKNIYLGVVCRDENQGRYIVQSLRRDFFSSQNDNVSIYLDPYDGLTNGFLFGVTPLGVQKEGLISGGDNISTIWDNVWYSKTRIVDDGWIAEIRIPFKSIRYDDELTSWNIQFDRNDLKRNERSTWTRVEQQFRPQSMAFSGRLAWDTIPPKAGSNVSIIPYLLGSAERDIENGEDVMARGDAGFDAKVALSSALNLDLTVNPDFSTVEVDRQVTNLSRFELYFPERRQFFLENSDLFGDFGFSRSRVFFSRRIGLASPMLFGARLSGNIGGGWRTGLMNAQTTRDLNDDYYTPAYNFGVASFQKQIFGRSNISGIFVNKQAINFEKDQEGGYDFGDNNEYNRVYGLEYNLMSSNNKWEGDFYLFQSRDPVSTTGNWAHGAFLGYNVREFRIGWSHEYIGENYNAEVGYVPRTGIFRFGPFFNYRFYPRSLLINQHGPRARYSMYFDPDWDVTDRDVEIGYEINFQNSSELGFEVQDNYVKLRDDFDPTNSGDDSSVVPLPKGSDYNWQSGSIYYGSDRRKDFSMFVATGYGGYYNGIRYGVFGSLNYRIRPIFTIALNYSYNNIELPDPHSDASYWLVGPRIDLTFTDNLFWTTFIQYNEQADNVNINTRLQWRFKPVSDFYVVYTDNYLPDGLLAKSRSIVLKVSYWINL